MKKDVIFFFLLTILVSNCYCDNGEQNKKKICNNAFQHAYSVMQTNDGGYILAGDNGSFGCGFSDICLVKTDSKGNMKWNKIFDGNGSDSAFSVQQTNDNGYIIAGALSAAPEYKRYSDKNNSGFRIYLIKTDGSGDCVWAKTYNGLGQAVGRSVCQTTDNGFIVAGCSSKDIKDKTHIYLIKTDSRGDCVWARAFDGKKESRANSVVQTSDGGYILAGYTASFGTGNNDVYLIKTDSKGDCVWTKTFGGKRTDVASSVIQTKDGGYALTGWSNSFDGDQYDIYFIKTDSKGDCVWAKTFYGKEDDAGWSIRQTTDGGYIIAGNTNSFGAGNKDIYIIKTDANGDCVWTRTFGTKLDEGAYSAQQTSDGGYIIACGANINDSKGNDYAYMIKLDANGNRQW